MILGVVAVTLQLVLPQAVTGAVETLTLCRAGDGTFSIAGTWQPADRRAPAATAPEGARCRVLLRQAGRARYLATAEVVWSAHAAPLHFRPGWLHTLQAPPSSGPTQFVSTAGANVDCIPLPSRTQCHFVPVDEPGVIITHHDGATLFVLAGEGGSSAWRQAAWGRLVRVRGPAPHQAVTAAITRLEPVLRRGSSLLRQAKAFAGAEVYPLGADAFWIVAPADTRNARLELRAYGAAAMTVALAELRGSVASVVDLAMAPESVIDGQVRSRGVLIHEATVTLARLLDAPGLLKDEDRPREWVGEALTARDGSFRFAGLDRGKYEVVAFHAAAGRARAIVTPSAYPRISLAPPAVARGRVLRSGVPVASAVVSAVPAFETVSDATNPLLLMAEPGRTGVDGRFEVMLPDAGRAVLTIAAADAAVRLELGDVSGIDSSIDLGDIKLEPAIELEVLLDLPATCRVQSAGPLGAPGLSVASLSSLGAGRWRFLPSLPGRWLVEAECGGRELPLVPAVIDVRRDSREPVVLKVVR